MSCEICGRGNCTRSFHSFESQDEVDNIADDIKERMRSSLLYSIRRIKDVIESDGVDYVNFDEVENVIENY